MGIEYIVNFSTETIVTTQQKTHYNYALSDVIKQISGGDEAQINQYITSNYTKEMIYKYQFVKKTNTSKKTINDTKNTAIDQLIKLSELLEKKLITQKEFEEQKQIFLSQ